MSIHLLKLFLNGELDPEKIEQIKDKNKIAINFKYNGSESFSFDGKEITKEEFESITNKRYIYEFVRPE